MLNRLISIAPMMGMTDSHYRVLMRCITQHTLLYTEMLTTQQLLHGHRWKSLGYSPIESPLALQLGGSSPADLAKCARIAMDYGFDEINLNVGCPSHRAQAGEIGVCLFIQPERVADCVSAMRAVVSIPVTVKTRIGVDHKDSYAHLDHFVSTVAAAGCRTFIIHARKAWLSGLNPKRNRSVPPLSYPTVYRLKKGHPDLEIIVNGGVSDSLEIDEHLQAVDGVMIGRAAYHHPGWFGSFDAQYFKQDTSNSIAAQRILERYLPYMRQQLMRGVPFSMMARHLHGLYRGQSGAKAWRTYLHHIASQPNLSYAIDLLSDGFVLKS